MKNLRILSRFSFFSQKLNFRSTFQPFRFVNIRGTQPDFLSSPLNPYLERFFFSSFVPFPFSHSSTPQKLLRKCVRCVGFIFRTKKWHHQAKLGEKGPGSFPSNKERGFFFLYRAREIHRKLKCRLRSIWEVSFRGIELHFGCILWAPGR